MRLLIVDDNPTNIKLLMAMVAGFGECEAADCGEKAISEFKKAWEDWRPFSFIFLDILMPEMDGTQVLCKIREIENDKNVSEQHRVKIIMVTALPDKNMVIECLSEGCDDYIVKPVDSKLLVGKIKKLGLMNSN